MSYLLKVVPVIFLNPILWVVLFYYIKSTKSQAFDEYQNKALGIGLALFIFGISGGVLFQDLFVSALHDKGLYTDGMLPYFFRGYYFLWGLVSALGFYKIIGVYFQNAVAKE